MLPLTREFGFLAVKMGADIARLLPSASKQPPGILTVTVETDE